MAYDNQNSNELQGALFRNDRKTQPNHPDYQGQCVIAGVPYWLSAWSKDSKNGTRYLSLAFKPKDAPAAKPAVSASDDDLASTPVAGSARAEPARETPQIPHRQPPESKSQIERELDDDTVPF